MTNKIRLKLQILIMNDLKQAQITKKKYQLTAILKIIQNE